MGLTSWTGEVPRKAEVAIAKNYLAVDELEALNRIVNACGVARRRGAEESGGAERPAPEAGDQVEERRTWARRSTVAW